MEHSTFAWSTNTEHNNKHETSSSVSRAFSSSIIFLKAWLLFVNYYMFGILMYVRHTCMFEVNYVFEGVEK
jgi:hypothetical protein